RERPSTDQFSSNFRDGRALQMWFTPKAANMRRSASAERCWFPAFIRVFFAAGFAPSSVPRGLAPVVAPTTAAPTAVAPPKPPARKRLRSIRVSRWSAPIVAHELPLGQDAALHSSEQLAAVRFRRQIEEPVQSVEAEEVAVRLAARRRRPVVTDLVEVVPPLSRAVGQRLHSRHALLQRVLVRRQVVDNPVDPDAARGVRVFAKQR